MDNTGGSYHTEFSAEFKPCGVPFLTFTGQCLAYRNEEQPSGRRGSRRREQEVPVRRSSRLSDREDN